METARSVICALFSGAHWYGAPVSLAAQIPPAWQASLATVVATPEFKALEAFVEGEFASHQVLPEASRVFAALQATAPDDVSVLLLGQDPYPTPGHANGLAFSVAPGVKVPPSLKNLYAALSAERQRPPRADGDLTPWAESGVLLLNTVLTVRAGESNSHRKRGWEAFTGAIVESLCRQARPLVFFCLGKPAQALVARAQPGPQHLVLDLPHPSPLNGSAFVTEAKVVRPFSQIDAFLERHQRPPIQW